MHQWISHLALGGGGLLNYSTYTLEPWSICSKSNAKTNSVGLLHPPVYEQTATWSFRKQCRLLSVLFFWMCRGRRARGSLPINLVDKELVLVRCVWLANGRAIIAATNYSLVQWRQLWNRIYFFPVYLDTGVSRVRGVADEKRGGFFKSRGLGEGGK